MADGAILESAGLPATAGDAEAMGWPTPHKPAKDRARNNPPIISVGRYPDDGKDRGQCACCDQPATGYVLVKYGDKTTPEPSCARHRKMAMKRDGRFWAHFKTKDRFMAGELPTRPALVSDAE